MRDCVPVRASKDYATRLALMLALVVVLALVAAIAVVSFTYHKMVLGGQWALSSEWLRQADTETRAAALGQLGDYFGGTLNPILSFSGFLVLLITVLLQRRQLQEGTRQLEQSTRALNLDAFLRINDILQTEPGIAARARLCELFYGTAERKPFDQWAEADQQAAHTAARQFDLVGQLVEGKLFDPTLFLRNWHPTVEKCWAACEAMVAGQRERRNEPAFCQRFEALNALARACRLAAAPE